MVNKLVHYFAVKALNVAVFFKITHEIITVLLFKLQF